MPWKGPGNWEVACRALFGELQNKTKTGVTGVAWGQAANHQKSSWGGERIQNRDWGIKGITLGNGVRASEEKYDKEKKK